MSPAAAVLPARHPAPQITLAAAATQARPGTGVTGPWPIRAMRSGSASGSGQPRRGTGRSCYFRFLFTTFSAIDVFSPSSGITTHAAR